MIIFYDPSAENQIMAVYTHDTRSTAWTDQGFVRAEVVDGVEASRDHCIEAFDDEGRVARIRARKNPVQPAPTADPRLAKIGAMDISDRDKAVLKDLLGVA